MGSIGVRIKSLKTKSMLELWTKHTCVKRSLAVCDASIKDDKSRDVMTANASTCATLWAGQGVLHPHLTRIQWTYAFPSSQTERGSPKLDDSRVCRLSVNGKLSFWLNYSLASHYNHIRNKHTVSWVSLSLVAKAAEDERTCAVGWAFWSSNRKFNTAFYQLLYFNGDLPMSITAGIFELQILPISSICRWEMIWSGRTCKGIPWTFGNLPHTGSRW
jgi:hypothetical protein